MKRPLAVILGIIALVVLVYWIEPRPQPAPPPPPPIKPATVQTASAIRPPVPVPMGDNRVRPQLPRDPLPGNVVPPIVEPFDAQTEIDLNKISAMLRDYRTLTNENPVGSNAEIMRTCMGDNPKRAKLGPPDGLSLNPSGELVDRWGTPFFFHQLSKDTMEIRSAGPDRKMWTGDDVVTR